MRTYSSTQFETGYEINRKHDLNICIAEFSVHGTGKVHINRHQRVRDLIK